MLTCHWLRRRLACRWSLQRAGSALRGVREEALQLSEGTSSLYSAALFVFPLAVKGVVFLSKRDNATKAKRWGVFVVGALLFATIAAGMGAFSAITVEYFESVVRIFRECSSRWQYAARFAVCCILANRTTRGDTGVGYDIVVPAQAARGSGIRWCDIPGCSC